MLFRGYLILKRGGRYPLFLSISGKDKGMNLVKVLRREAKNYGDETVLLPKEFAQVLKEVKEEEGWERVSVKELMEYLADMLE